MYNRDYINLTNNNELYHFGRKGMKWGKHLFGEEARARREEMARNHINKAGSVSKAEANVTRTYGKNVMSNVYKNLLVDSATGVTAAISAVAGIPVLPVAAIAAGAGYGVYTFGKNIVQTGEFLGTMRALKKVEVPEKYNDVYRDK